MDACSLLKIVDCVDFSVACFPTTTPISPYDPIQLLQCPPSPHCHQAKMTFLSNAKDTSSEKQQEPSLKHKKMGKSIKKNKKIYKKKQKANK